LQPFLAAPQLSTALQVQGLFPQRVQRAALQPFLAAPQLSTALQVQGLLPQRVQRAPSQPLLPAVPQAVWQPSQAWQQPLHPCCTLLSQWFQSVPLWQQGAQASTARKTEAVCAVPQVTVSLFRIANPSLLKGGRQENVPAFHPMRAEGMGAKTEWQSPSARQMPNRGANGYASPIPA
jgi:hypothetical protein